MRVYGNLNNRIMEHTTGEPVAGMGCTITMFSDRMAATVVEVKSPTTIIVQEDTATRTDKNGMSECQTYDYTRDPRAPKRTFTKRKNGTWKERGANTGLVLGTRRAYHDYSF